MKLINLTLCVGATAMLVFAAACGGGSPVPDPGPAAAESSSTSTAVRAQRGILAADAGRAYPGDDVVDIVGLDAYDTSMRRDPEERWQDQLDRPNGLRWHAGFAKEHGKPMAFPEWGVVVRPRDELGGGDAPLYVERMIEWIRSHNVVDAIYFDVDAPDAAHRLSRGRFPRSAAAFLRDAPALAQTASAADGRALSATTSHAPGRKP